MFADSWGTHSGIGMQPCLELFMNWLTGVLIIISDPVLDTELNTSGEVQPESAVESAVELEISEISEVSEDESMTEEEYQKLVEEEYALRLEHEELLAIGIEIFYNWTILYVI